MNAIYYQEAERRRERAYWAEIEAEEELAAERRNSELPLAAPRLILFILSSVPGEVNRRDSACPPSTLNSQLSTV